MSMTDDGDAGMVRVLIVDDEAIIRAGLEMLLEATPGIQVVGKAADGREALKLVEAERPDVVLMDLRMPVLDGVRATAEIARHYTHTRVLALTTLDDESLMYEALRAGASGYLLKQAAPAQLADALRRVHAGASWIDPDMAGRVIGKLREHMVTDGDPTMITDSLTPREQEVLRLVAQGLSNQEIRDELVLSEATVKTHVARILMKTGSRDRAAAVALAWRTGFVGGLSQVPPLN
ncbi:MAG: response regulator transcription factor [Propioniciclava sp.]|uniref:response regulator n=1 Tax=Propioniciclava sp. TaxID=2038686 RepID=UPI0039E4B53F